jgi:hypothetical protein
MILANWRTIPHLSVRASITSPILTHGAIPACFLGKMNDSSGHLITSQITSQITSPIFCDVIEHVADRFRATP